MVNRPLLVFHNNVLLLSFIKIIDFAADFKYLYLSPTEVDDM